MCADDDPAEPLAARAKPMNQSTGMAHSEIRAALNLFNEKADKLRNSNFVKAALENSGASLSWQKANPFRSPAPAQLKKTLMLSCSPYAFSCKTMNDHRFVTCRSFIPTKRFRKSTEVSSKRPARI